MRRFQSLNTWSMLAAAGVVASAAAAQPTLTQLNSGPSTNGPAVPAGDDSTVATFAFPREVVNTAVADVPSGTLNGTAGANSSLTVQTGAGAGFRNRSRATFPEPSAANAAAALQLIANSNAAGVAANSFVFIGRSSDLGTGVGQIGNSITSLLAFIAAGTEGTQFFQIPFTAYPAIDTDAEITEALLNAGVNMLLSEFYAGDPDGGGPFNANSYRFNSTFDVALFAIDTGGSADPEVVTEFAFLPRAGINTTPSLAATGASPTMIADIRILANRQLIDDLTGAGGNPGDTTAGTLSAATDFLVATDALGGGSQSLATYLASLTGAPAITGITVTGTGTGDFNRIITLDVTPDIANATDVAAIRSRFIGFAPGAGGGTVFGFHGGLPANTAFAQMGQAGDLGVSQARLLQGSGTGASQVWVAVDASGDISAPGTNDQFELVVTEGGTTVVVATGTAGAASSTVPLAAAVPGIDDTNLDGTTTDPVITTASNRFFVQFDLANPGGGLADAINSDATWSRDGGGDFTERATRLPLTLRRAAGGTPASNPLGSGIGATVMVSVGDLARPQAIAHATDATGDTDYLGLCEVVDQLDIVFDEAVSLGTSPANLSGIRYNPAVVINDLTDGLSGALGLRTATAAASAATLSGLISPTPTPSRTTTNVANDTVSFDAPEIPLTADAADGTEAADGILPGTGFVDPDGVGAGTGSPYKLAADNNLVTTTAVGGVVLGNVRTTGATFASNALTAGGVDVTDGASAALVAANGTDGGDADEDLDSIVYGLSENIVADATGGQNTTEAESYVFIMENDTVGRRIALSSGSTVVFNADNTFTLSLAGSDELDADDAVSPGFVTAINNPGYAIFDVPSLTAPGTNFNAPNRIDPSVAKTKMVEIGRPSATFKTTGVAMVNPITNKVVSFMLKVTGEVQLVSGGSASNLLQRFYVRGGVDLNGDGDFTDPGESSGEPLQLAGLVDSVNIGTVADADGCYKLTFTFMSGMPFTQESFAVQYVDSTAQADPAASTLVDADQSNSEVPSALISVSVLRAPVIEGDSPGADGNPLTMTFAGNLLLNGSVENGELGAVIKAWVWSSVGLTGKVQFTYKGQRFTGNLLLVDGAGKQLLTSGSVLYFHPQLKGTPGANGTMEPCGIINSKPDLDLYSTAELTTAQTGGGVPNITTTQQAFLYQNVVSQFVVNPIQLTFTAAPTSTAGNVGVFTFTGTGVTNGRLTSGGRFIEIGKTLVTGPENSDGSRPYTLHTRGKKEYRGSPVVLTCDPEDFFNEDDGDCFLVNNFFAGGPNGPLTFVSDIDQKPVTSGTSSAIGVPNIFNINQANVCEFAGTDLVFNDDGAPGNNWGGFPHNTNNGGFDFGTPLPNRFSVPGATAGSLVPANSTRSYPSGVDARGFFVFINKATCTPFIPTIDMALVIDNTGVFCDDVSKLTRLASGYATFLNIDNNMTSSDCWFTFGTKLSNVTNGQLTVGGTAANGNWSTVCNSTGAPLNPASSPFRVIMTLTGDDGILIGGSSAGTFADLDQVDADEAMITNQAGTSAVLN